MTAAIVAAALVAWAVYAAVAVRGLLSDLADAIESDTPAGQS